jgi:2'-5' RNA ligase
MSEDVTLGVFIAIPEPHASVLKGWRRQVGDPLAAKVPPHVTLLPPTQISRDELPAVHKHLLQAAESAPPFPMHLFGTGTFRPLSPVVFIQVARGIAECEVLEKAVRSGPLACDLHFPYHPHVTVAQEIPDAGLDEAYEGLAAFVARFQVAGFRLSERAPDGTWSTRGDYALGLL